MSRHGIALRCGPEVDLDPMTSSDTQRPDPHAGESMVGPHGAPDDHGEDHGHDDHAHGGEALGPLNLAAWGAAVLGVVLGLVVMFAFIQAAS
jgi:hypothetical protein